MHVIGTVRRAQVRPICLIFEIGDMDRTSGQSQVKLRLLFSIFFNNSTNGNIEEDAIDKRRTSVNPTEDKHE
jgi:hypothetical protein